MTRFQTIAAVLVAAVVMRQQSAVYAEPPGAGMENKAGQTLKLVGERKVFTGAVVNRGTIRITDSAVSFTGPYTELGAYISDPSVTNYTNLIVGSGGYLQGGLGDLFVVSGSFQNGSTQNTLWSTAQSELDFGNGSAHQYLLAGVDSGTSIAGYTNNFAFGTTRLYAGQTLVLGDGNSTPGAALYTGALVLDSGTAQIASITGNGYNIYYDSLNPMNNYLGAGTYALGSGGSILPISTLPPTMTGTAGQSFTFTATVIGSVAFTYQWYENGSAIGSATNSTYTISNATVGNSGTYSVTVSDTAGASTSGTSVLTVGSGVPAMPPVAFAVLALLLILVATPVLRAKQKS